MDTPSSFSSSSTSMLPLPTSPPTPDHILEMQNRGPPVLTVTIIMLVLSTVFVSLRLLSRAGIVKKMGSDDYAIMVAWLIAFGFSFSVCYGTSIGLGRHEQFILEENRSPLRKAQYVFTVLYNPALMATKTSICLFYLTLSKNHPVFKWLTYGTFAVVNIAGTALTFLNLFQCRPVGAAFLDPPPESATCIDIVALYLSSAPVNIITDLALLFLPMPILTGMRLPRNEHIILIVTFSFGAFVAVVDVVRIAYLESAALSRLKNRTSSENTSSYGDFSWVVSLSFMWSVVEVHIGIIVSCVPGIKPLVARYLPSILGRLKTAADLQGNAFSGPGDAQWANAASKNYSTSSGARSPPPRSPLPPTSPPAAPTRSSDSSERRDSMGMLDFLTSPDGLGGSDFPPRPPASRNNTTNTSQSLTFSQAPPTRPRSGSMTFLDFVHMKNPRCMVKLSNRDSFLPNMLVTILFFLWGFAYGLLDILNQQFQNVTHISQAQAIGLHAAYYGAYFIAPLTFGGWVFRTYGFKSTFMVGLCVYGVGTLVFWPSAVLASFPAFLISNFFIGLGVATLETAGNPFIALCGPPEYSEVRLNISQGVQAIGTVISPVLAEKVFFKNVTSARSLVDVQWAYLGIAFFDVILALIFHYLPIPEASDEDLESIALKRSAINNKRLSLPFLKNDKALTVTQITLVLGLFSNFCYVGAQESIASYFQDYIDAVRPRSLTGSPLGGRTAFDYQTVGHTTFAVGRFLTAFAGLYIKPRHLLLFLFLGTVVFSALAMQLSSFTGVGMIIMVMTFESGIFSLIFAITLRGLGARTKFGAIVLTASTCGGAVVPGVMSPVRASRGVQYAFAVIVAVFGAGTAYPIYLEGCRSAKKQVDPVAGKRRGSILPTEKMPVFGADGRVVEKRRMDWLRRRKGKQEGGDNDLGEKNKKDGERAGIEATAQEHKRDDDTAATPTSGSEDVGGTDVEDTVEKGGGADLDKDGEDRDEGKGDGGEVERETSKVEGDTSDR